MKPVVFSPDARAEVNEAREWYAERSDGASLRFVRDVEATVAAIASRPRQFPVVAGSFAERA